MNKMVEIRDLLKMIKRISQQRLLTKSMIFRTNVTLTKKLNISKIYLINVIYDLLYYLFICVFNVCI